MKDIADYPNLIGITNTQIIRLDHEMAMMRLAIVQMSFDNDNSAVLSLYNEQEIKFESMQKERTHLILTLVKLKEEFSVMESEFRDKTYRLMDEATRTK